MTAPNSEQFALLARLRENGEAAAQTAGKLRSVLVKTLPAEKLAELRLAISTRCVEAEDIRVSIELVESDATTRRVARQVENLWQEIARMVAEKGKTERW